MLLFALKGDSILYYIMFRGDEVSSQLSTAIKCADLSSCVLSEGGQEVL